MDPVYFSQGGKGQFYMDTWEPFLTLYDKDFLVAQWLRIRLPVQETQVRALVREDPTCRGATKPMCHNY